MPLLAQHLARGTGLDHLAGAHDREAVGDAGHHRQIMRDEHQPHAVLVDQPAQQIEDPRLGRHVERRRRLVRDQQLRAQRHGHRDHHPLPLAARQLVRIARQRKPHLRQPHPLERVTRDGPRLAPRRAGMDQHRLGHLVADGPQRIERGHRLLEDHAHVMAAQPAHLGLAPLQQLRAVEPDRPARLRPVRQQTHHGQRGHRLARPALADHAEHLARPERHRDAAQDRRAADREIQPRDVEQAHARTRRSFGSSRSRSPSPIRFSPSTVSTIAMPGKIASQGAKEIIVWLSASIRPQDGVGGCAPRPT